MVKQIIRCFRGTLTFTVTGPFPERFLNLCRRGGVALWSCCRDGDSITASTALRRRRQVEYYAGKAGVTLAAQEQRGFRPTLHRYRRRKGLLLGGVLLAAGFFLLSGMLWRIEIRGAETLGEETVREWLRENGVSIGAVTARIPCREIAKRLQASFPEVAWSALNIDGSTATVILEEAVLPVPDVDDRVPTNIVADRTGFVTRVETHAGNAVVAPGDSVREGQLLISGVMDNKNGESRTVRARGRVTAESRELLSVTVPLAGTRPVYRGTCCRKFLRFPGGTLPLTGGPAPKPPYRLTAAGRSPRGLLALLPVSVVTERYLLLTEEPCRLAPEEAAARARELLRKAEQQAFGDRRILSGTVTEKTSPEGVTLTGEYLTEGEIGTSVPIFVADP